MKACQGRSVRPLLTMPPAAAEFLTSHPHGKPAAVLVKHRSGGFCQTGTWQGAAESPWTHLKRFPVRHSTSHRSRSLCAANPHAIRRRHRIVTGYLFRYGRDLAAGAGTVRCTGGISRPGGGRAGTVGPALSSSRSIHELEKGRSAFWTPRGAVQKARSLESWLRTLVRLPLADTIPVPVDAAGRTDSGENLASKGDRGRLQFRRSRYGMIRGANGNEPSMVWSVRGSQGGWRGADAAHPELSRHFATFGIEVTGVEGLAKREAEPFGVRSEFSGETENTPPTKPCDRDIVSSSTRRRAGRAVRRTVMVLVDITL